MEAGRFCREILLNGRNWTQSEHTSIYYGVSVSVANPYDRTGDYVDSP